MPYAKGINPLIFYNILTMNILGINSPALLVGGCVRDRDVNKVNKWEREAVTSAEYEVPGGDGFGVDFAGWAS